MHFGEVCDMKQYAMATELTVSEWINADQPVRLQDLRGRVVCVSVFQMLCPASVSQAIPQAISIHQRFPAKEMAVLGLHSMFTHAAAFTPAMVRAFVQAYQIPFPVGLDKAPEGPGLPRTMQAYGFKGTPSLLIIDRQGRVRLQYFGRAEDLQIGALLGQLLDEPAPRL
jgi:hypothetical protein